MRHFILAICCAAATGLMPASAYSQSFGQAAFYGQRPPPPTETSIPVAEKPAAVKMDVAAPKPAVRPKIIHRPGKGPTGPVTMPSSDVLVMMVRSALTGVNQANFTENYAVLHGMTTPALQTRVSATQFGKAFAGLRQQNLDLSPVLVLAPQFTVAPSLTPQGVLRLAGIFPSRPLQINFAIDYVPIDGIWMIDALSVSALQPSAPGPVADSATSASPTGSQHARAPMKSAIWEASVSELVFGPSVRFAVKPN